MVITNNFILVFYKIILLLTKLNTSIVKCKYHIYVVSLLIMGSTHEVGFVGSFGKLLGYGMSCKEARFATLSLS
jgi:hypothetical protein